MKRFSAFILCVIMTVTLTFTSLPLVSCVSDEAPELSAVRDRIEEVLDASVDINAVLFGPGLPVYERDSAEDALINRYYTLSDDGRDLVSLYTRYTDTDMIEAAVRSVYCEKYADSLCEMLFTGYSMGSDSESILAARYYLDESTGNLFQSDSYEPMIDGIRIYDYDSMEIDPSSSSSFLKVNILCRKDEPNSEWHSVSLNFVPQDGTWYLDNPCY